MPLLRLEIAAPVPNDKKDKLLKACSGIIARVTGKPENYVMVTLDECKACMAGKPAAAAFGDVRGIGGLNQKVNAQLSSELCKLLKQELNVEPENVYLNFTDVPAQNWGWKGGTFG